MENDQRSAQLESLRRDQRERYRSTSLLYSMENNRIESDFRNTLYTVAIFLFTFSSPLFIDIKILHDSIKVLLFISWLFLLFSVCFGFWQTYIELEYYRKVSKRENAAESLWIYVNPTEQEFSDTVQKTQELYNNHERHTWMIPQILQVIFLFIGFVFIISSASVLLFR